MPRRFELFLTRSVKMVLQYHQVIPGKCEKKIKYILKRNNSRQISLGAFWEAKMRGFQVGLLS